MSSRNADATKLPDLREFNGLISDRVYEAIKAAILSLDFAPGAIIRKGAICDQFGISRTPVSDALSKLENEGLVDVVPQSATRVAKMSMKEIREDAFLREALEVAAVGYAAEHRSEELLARLTRNLNMQRLQITDGDYEEFHRTDLEFHRLILECCKIKRLSDTIRLVSNNVDRARLLLLPETRRTTETLGEHDLILDAIRAADPAAAQLAMKNHLRQLLRRLTPLEKLRPELFAP
ncbi:GntR family transcriptional regulator [Litoreibacter sp.]|nr:GntR family transcriptional regulator [Litoreibacter sp.]